MPDEKELRQKCDAAGQEHLFHFWSRLDESQRSDLLVQIAATDLERVNRIYRRSVDADDALRPKNTSAGNGHAAHGQGNGEAAPQDAEPIRPLPEEAFESIIGEKEKENCWRDVGLAAIRRSEVGVLLMAGGQGTRLGSSAPKGCYDIGLPSHKSLFQLQAERITRLQVLAADGAGANSPPPVITWYIMTSGPTRSDTETFFKEHDCFGLDAHNIVFFEQGTLPCLTMDGKIIMDSPSRIAVAPDGNGGLYAALRRPISPSAGASRSVLSDMAKRGIRYIHTYGVDNCLVRVADPVFLGCGIAKQADCAVKVVRKVVPSESVGVVAMRGQRYSVVEYSEISKAQAEQRDPKSGELAFRAANIVNHFYTTDFLREVEAHEDRLAFHIARKKIPYVDAETVQQIKPSKPNGMKLELFVFDVFPFARRFAVMEVERAEEFSPLKNAPGTGTDDPETSRRDILSQHRRFLENAGALVREDVAIELSPLVTYSGEALTSVKGKTFSKSGIASEVSELDALL